MMVATSVVLPTPLRPMIETRLAVLEREPDLFQHDGLAVAGGDVVELEREGLAHGRASRCA